MIVKTQSSLGLKSSIKNVYIFDVIFKIKNESINLLQETKEEKFHTKKINMDECPQKCGLENKSDN